MIDRRAIVSTAAAAVALAAGGGARAAAPASDTMSMGNPGAPVSVDEFGSLGCPICAQWNVEVFPAFKAQFIDTGRVRFTLHEFLTGDQLVAAQGFLLARCAGPGRYFQVVDAVFRAERPYLETEQSAAKRGAMVRVAQSFGISQAQLDACVGNDAALNALIARSNAAAQVYKVSSTPTFRINGQMVVGYQTLTDLAAAIAKAGRR
jgi:protein-disulfide isomerase